MIEGHFQKRLVDGLRGLRAVVLNKAGNVREGQGWPDLFVWHPKFTGMLELKVGKRKISPAQYDRVAEFRRVGSDARFVRWTFEENRVIRETHTDHLDRVLAWHHWKEDEWVKGNENLLAAKWLKTFKQL